MAKKVVATLKKEGANRQFTKVIRSVKSEKSGYYTFKEEIVPAEEAQKVVNS